MVMALETKTIVYRVAAPQQVMWPHETTARIPTPTFVPILLYKDADNDGTGGSNSQGVLPTHGLWVVQAMPATPIAPPRLN